jgi:hypothetical protein
MFSTKLYGIIYYLKAGIFFKYLQGRLLKVDVGFDKKVLLNKLDIYNKSRSRNLALRQALMSYIQSTKIEAVFFELIYDFMNCECQNCRDKLLIPIMDIKKDQANFYIWRRLYILFGFSGYNSLALKFMNFYLESLFNNKSLVCKVEALVNQAVYEYFDKFHEIKFSLIEKLLFKNTIATATNFSGMIRNGLYNQDIDDFSEYLSDKKVAIIIPFNPDNEQVKNSNTREIDSNNIVVRFSYDGSILPLSHGSKANVSYYLNLDVKRLIQGKRINLHNLEYLCVKKHSINRF